MFWLALAFAIALAVIHLWSGRLALLSDVPRSRWLSAAGGISVAYVFVHVLPELAEGREHLKAIVERRWLEEGIFLLAMAGLVIFYGLERMAKSSKTEAGTPPGVFWIHISSFAVYNALIGYVLARQEYRTTTSIVMFFIAMGTHFVVNDHALRADHHERYDRIGRWLLAAAVMVGFIIGSAAEFSRVGYELLFAFLAGGVVLNVLKEELPEERQSRYWAFTSAVVAYAALLLLI
jgi:hypothetical protein